LLLAPDQFQVRGEVLDGVNVPLEVHGCAFVGLREVQPLADVRLVEVV